MKKFNFPLILLLLVAACHSTSDHEIPRLPSVVAAEPSLEPTGNVRLDSLLQLTITAKQDTNLARLYHQIGVIYETFDFEKAKAYFLKLGNLSEQLDWNLGRYLFAGSFSYMLTREGLIDSAITVNLQAIDLAKKEKDANRVATISMNIGGIYMIKQWHLTALDYYMDALSYYEPLNNTGRLGHLYYMMSKVYDNLSLTDIAIEYGEKALVLNKDVPLPYLLETLANAYFNAYQYEKANDYLEEALRICQSENNIYLMGTIYYQLGRNALGVYDLEKAESYAQQAIEISLEAGGTNTSVDLLLLGKIAQLKGNYIQSEAYVREALLLTEKFDNLSDRSLCYRILSELAVTQRKYEENMQYWGESNRITKALANETAIRSAAEMEARYETEKKELKITALEEERQLMLLLSMSGGAVLLLSLASFYFLWRWTVQKKRVSEQQHQLAETRIKQLEQEKQLVATQSVLDGETRERARLARDLHDGLGSLLTGAKLQLIEMKQGAKLEYADVERFDKALGLLDKSVNEMRRVAHHLMPDSLSRFGLKPAVTDFCANLPTVQFAYYGDESRLDPNLEVMIYRSIYELVNNALKHAGATRIMVQIIQEPDRIDFTVQDDGCGFDLSAVTEGMGLQNIRTRVESYNGLLDIASKTGEGTEINVELRIEDRP